MDIYKTSSEKPLKGIKKRDVPAKFSEEDCSWKNWLSHWYSKNGFELLCGNWATNRSQWVNRNSHYIPNFVEVGTSTSLMYSKATSTFEASPKEEILNNCFPWLGFFAVFSTWFGYIYLIAYVYMCIYIYVMIILAFCPEFLLCSQGQPKLI